MSELSSVPATAPPAPASAVALAPAGATKAEVDWRPLGRWAIAELAVGHIENALRAYRVLSAVNPGEERWHIGLCLCAVQLGYSDEARRALSRVGSQRPLVLERYRKRLELLGDGKSLPLATSSSPLSSVSDSAALSSDGDAQSQGSVIPFPKKPSP